MALIWLMAWLQIKAMWITQERMIRSLSAETCPSAFGPFHTLKYFQNNGNFIWNTVSIFWKNLGRAMATLSPVMLSHCIDIRDVKSSIEMVSTLKLGVSLVHREKRSTAQGICIPWPWTRLWPSSQTFPKSARQEIPSFILLYGQ